MRIRTQICLVSFAFLIFGCSYFEKASVDNTISIERDALNLPSFLRGKYLVEGPAGWLVATRRQLSYGTGMGQENSTCERYASWGKKMIDNIMMTVYAHNLTPGSRITIGPRALKLSTGGNKTRR